MSWYWWLSRW